MNATNSHTANACDCAMSDTLLTYYCEGKDGCRQAVNPIGYAVQMADGHFVGIWRDQAIALGVCAKQPKGHGDRVVPVYAAPSETRPMGREVCPDCYRFKARNADDCAAGDCSKWYAIRDKEAAADCTAFKNKTGYYATPAPASAPCVVERKNDAWRSPYDGSLWPAEDGKVHPFAEPIWFDKRHHERSGA